MGVCSEVVAAPAQNNDSRTLLRHRFQFQFDPSQCVCRLARGNRRVV